MCNARGACCTRVGNELVLTMLLYKELHSGLCDCCRAVEPGEETEPAALAVAVPRAEGRTAAGEERPRGEDSLQTCQMLALDLPLRIKLV